MATSSFPDMPSHYCPYDVPKKAGDIPYVRERLSDEDVLRSELNRMCRLIRHSL